MYILCNDPGYKNIGMAIIEFDVDTKKVTLHKAENITLLQTPGTNLFDLYQYLGNFISGYVIDAYAYEKPYLQGWALSKNIGMLEGIGLCKTQLYANNPLIRMYDYSPTEIKKALSGSGKADKDIMSGLIKEYFHDTAQTIPFNHACDALATGLTYLHVNFGLSIRA